MPNKLIEEIESLYQKAISEKPEGFSLDYGCTCFGGPLCSETDYIDKISNSWPQLKQLIEAGEELMKGVNKMDGMKLSECGNFIPMSWSDWKKQQMDLLSKYNEALIKTK